MCVSALDVKEQMEGALLPSYFAYGMLLFIMQFFQQGILRPREMECLGRAHHKPGYIVSMIDEVVASSEAYARGEVSCGDNVAFFNHAVGSTERIFKTPIPLSWTSKPLIFEDIRAVWWCAYKSPNQASKCSRIPRASRGVNCSVH